MEHQVIYDFKMLYTKVLFADVLMSLKKHPQLNVLQCINLTKKVWEDVMYWT